MEDIQIGLAVKDMPRQWYNIQPDLPEPLPPPVGSLVILSKAMLAESLAQETSKERFVEIPEEVRAIYQLWRPTPLFRARNLERCLGLSPGIKLFYKAEYHGNPTGSHKVNTAVPQAFYAKQEGKRRLTTETGAGQWGSALAFAASQFGLELTVYWVRAVFNWKKERGDLMKCFGADVLASPSRKTEAGRKLLKQNPKHPGSLGIAISEALEDAASHDEAVYCLGSVLNHVLMHQTIIGLEAKAQLEKVDVYPDVVVSCLGGGSNFGGLALPFLGDVLREGRRTRFLAVQSQGAANLQGEYKYDFADHAELTPQLMMYTLGHTAEMPPIKADGLRYHACAPILSLLRHRGFIDTIALPVDEERALRCGLLFMRTEGQIPAPESAYSIAGAIHEARQAMERGEDKIILFNVSGHGFLDIKAYMKFLRLK